MRVMQRRLAKEVAAAEATDAELAASEIDALRSFLYRSPTNASLDIVSLTNEDGHRPSTPPITLREMLPPPPPCPMRREVKVATPLVPTDSRGERLRGTDFSPWRALLLESQRRLEKSQLRLGLRSRRDSVTTGENYDPPTESDALHRSQL